MSKKESRNSTPHRGSRPSNIHPSPGLHYEIDTERTALDQFIPSFSELSDNLVDLDSNLQQIQSIHESLNNFNESFASFLYGLQINAYTVEFNEIPNFKNFKQDEIREKIDKLEQHFKEQDRVDDTYMTNDEDGSFLVQPTSSRASHIPEKPSRQSHRPPVKQPVRQAQPPQQQQQSKIPVGRRVTGGVTKPTRASEGRQRDPVQKDSRPPFR